MMNGGVRLLREEEEGKMCLYICIILVQKKQQQSHSDIYQSACMHTDVALRFENAKERERD